MKKIIIDSNPSFITSVIQDSDSLKVNNIFFDSLNDEVVRGNIYFGHITSISPALEAMFVNYGVTKNAFLPFNDIHDPKLIESFKVKDKIMVQVVKEAKLKKGISVTTQISISGRYLVYMPNHERSGVVVARSLRKKQSFRKNLVFPENSVTKGMYILRTSCLNADAEQILKEKSSLDKRWETIQDAFDTQDPKKSCLLYSNNDCVHKIINEYVTHDVELISVASHSLFNHIKSAYFGPAKVLSYKGNSSILKHYKVANFVDSVFMRSVRLRSGGSLTIEPTEALTSIDVNSGKSTSCDSLENTALQTNVEAVNEIANQIRFRNTNGIIIVDTIDMQSEHNKTLVENTFQESLKEDKAQTYCSKISPLGIIEVSRQNVGNSFHDSRETCFHCKGKGMTASRSRYYSGIHYIVDQHLKQNKNTSQIKIFLSQNSRSNHVRDKYFEALKNHRKIEIKETSKFSIPECVVVIQQQKKGFLNSDTFFSAYKHNPLITAIPILTCCILVCSILVVCISL